MDVVKWTEQRAVELPTGIIKATLLADGRTVLEGKAANVSDWLKVAPWLN